jgi:glycosyltransferase involved in cell wall biosynthesis
VSDGVNGFLYDPDKEGSLTTAVANLLGETDTRRALRRAAREEAERWGWAAATEQLRGYYRQVLGQRRLELVA